MSDTSITLLRLSANLAMFALKGKQGGAANRSNGVAPVAVLGGSLDYRKSFYRGSHTS
jgi:hypothetical protein